MSERTTILMLSGGLDSTACLFKLLEATKDDVHTFYVKLENNDRKVWCENEAIKRIRELKTREFAHHHGSEFDIRGTSPNGIQPFLWMTASIFMLNKLEGKRKRLCIGYTAGDSAVEYLADLKAHWEYMWGWMGDGKLVPMYLPLEKRTKMQSMDYLRRLEYTKGYGIIEHLWTCEDPQRFHGPNGSGYKACKKCIPCERGLEIGLVQP